MFRDRRDAGRRLAERLEPLAAEHPVVVGLPRGGVPVAFEVARALKAPLDVLGVRKLGVPYQPELGLGAIAERGVRVLNEELVAMSGVSEEELARIEARERAELERRVARFRGDLPPHDLAGRTVVLVDDGLATGGTARAAIGCLRRLGAGRVVLAVPVGAPDTVQMLSREADEVVCLEVHADLMAIGLWYDDFAQTTDDEVVRLLGEAAAWTPPREHVGEGPVEPGPGDDPPGEREVSVPVGPVHLPGSLRTPAAVTGLVIFAHGSGSSRLSPRNRFVADVLHEAGLATLLFDLLTPVEAADRANVFDVPALAERLGAAREWARHEPEGSLPVGYFGASTGAAAALWAAADDPSVMAVVSRGGRPDLAAEHLARVRAPTLLIVGGHDDVVLDLNRRAQRMLVCENRLDVVPGATHLFEEPGTLEQAAALARDWFREHLRVPAP
ncbi:MAG: phosphoribosyltransferase family protein [Acidimicrobiia bacterium]|nr:phosphoribosyltransferase family protein [Acidimicrobiia bacterium]